MFHVKPKSQPEVAQKPSLMERLRSIYGSYGAYARELGVTDAYPQKWKSAGYIPERWALDVHRLNARDEFGQITAMTVLYEAEAARRRMIREIDQGASG